MNESRSIDNENSLDLLRFGGLSDNQGMDIGFCHPKMHNLHQVAPTQYGSSLMLCARSQCRMLNSVKLSSLRLTAFMFTFSTIKSHPSSGRIIPTMQSVLELCSRESYNIINVQPS